MRFDEFDEPKIGDILEVEIGDEIVETVIVGITESGDYLCETNSDTGMSLLESRSDWDSNMPGYKGDYGGAENWGRREREDDEHHEIDRQREQQLAQYNQTGNFWLKYKDSGKHISDQPYVGKAAANAAALLMIRSNPEVKGNLLITAYGPDEVREAKQRLDPKCWDGYKKSGTKMKGDTRVNNCVPESAEQGVAEERWRVTVGNKSGTLSHTKVFTGTKEQAIKQAVKRFATTKDPVVRAELAEDLNEFAQGSGGGESGRWYTDDQMTDLVGDGWYEDMDVSGNIPKQQMIQQAQVWLDDQGYSVQVLNAKLNDDDMDWFIQGSFHNPNFAKKGMGEAYGPYGKKSPADLERIKKYKEREAKRTVPGQLRKPGTSKKSDYTRDAALSYFSKTGESVGEGYTVTRGIDHERYQARDGLEGPFSTKSGKVVYYDKVEGKYYDPDTDMYIEYADWQAMNEAEYQGRNVPLGKPMQGDVAKSKVYVKNPQGKVVKVNFGDKEMRIKKSNPDRRKSFRARHNCDNPGPRHKARYWSCRAW